jgi:MFS family permease
MPAGGVTSMDPFLDKFFPEVFHKKKGAKTNQYCKYDNQLLQTFTSSLYLAALVASFFAATVTRVMGRKWSMFGGGLTFLIGAALNGAAENVAMLIVGRILLGVGVGFANQVLLPRSSVRPSPAYSSRCCSLLFDFELNYSLICSLLILFHTTARQQAGRPGVAKKKTHL